MIMEHPLQLEMIPCNTGKNGLDFQLSSYLGYLLRSSAKARYVILSKDMGYDPLIQFWKERGAEITRESAQEVVKAFALPLSRKPFRRSSSSRRRRSLREGSSRSLQKKCSPP